VRCLFIEVSPYPSAFAFRASGVRRIGAAPERTNTTADESDPQNPRCSSQGRTELKCNVKTNVLIAFSIWTPEWRNGGRHSPAALVNHPSPWVRFRVCLSRWLAIWTTF